MASTIKSNRDPFVSSFGNVVTPEEITVALPSEQTERAAEKGSIEVDRIPNMARTEKRTNKAVKTSFYCKLKLLEEFKIYCVRHHTSMTLVINKHIETLLHGDK